jgi:site-specific DNA-cytosine methylase
LVICGNVAGLLKRNRGRNPQIYPVRAAFEKLGYSFAHMQLDARHFLVPQRRTRFWMWDTRLDVSAACGQTWSQSWCFHTRGRSNHIITFSQWRRTLQ